MSIENNQLRTIDGLNLIVCDVINIVESIEINGDNGNPNQLIISNGTTIDWGGIDDLMEDLTATSPISFNTGSTYNGLTARTLEIVDGAIGNIKLTNSTISGKDLGTNLDNISFTSPLTIDSYNGSTAKTIGIANGAIDNIKLADSTISGVSLGDDLETLTFTGYDTGTYDGSGSLSINLVDTDTTYSAGENILIDGSNEISTNPTSINYITLSFKQSATSTSLVGNAIGAKTPMLFFDLTSTSNSFPSATLGATSISLGATATDLDMGTGEISNAVIVDSNLLSDTNLFLPSNVFVVGGAYHMPFNAGIFHTNDDHSYYNYVISDSGVKIDGRGKIMNSTLEISGLINIPRGWSATGSMIDIRDSGGNVLLTPTYQMKRVFTYRIEGFIPVAIPSSIALYYGSGVSVGTEQSFYGGVSVVSAVDETLVIDVDMTSTGHYIGGGYIVLTPPAFF